MDVKILRSKTVSAEEKQKQKSQTILLSILLAVFIFMLISSLVKAQKKAQAKKLPARPAAADTSNSSVAQNAQQTPPPDFSKVPDSATPNPDVGNVSWGSSPFSMRGQDTVNAPQAAPIQLAGIIYDPSGNSYAMFGEKIVKKGDRIADNTVKEIKRNQVVLETGEGKEIVLQN